MTDGAAHQLEACDGQEHHDGQGAQRFELAMTVGVVFVGLPCGDADDDEPQHVVRSIHGGVQGVAEHGERARPHADRRFGDDNGDIGHEQSPEYATYGEGPI